MLISTMLWVLMAHVTFEVSSFTLIISNILEFG